MKGYIEKIESFASLDGDGIRYAIFLSGCNLRCAYCHNPETWIGQGQEFTADELIKKIIRFKPYFKGGGGVTFSGGEPLLQADFMIQLCQLLKENDIDIALDTSASQLSEKIKDVYKIVNTPIVDLKFYNTNDYFKYTKGDFDTVVKTLEFLNSIGKQIIVRTVIVPQINDNENDILQYYNLIKRFDNVKKYQLLPFHTMGFSKYEKLLIENPLANTLSLHPKKLCELENYLNMLIQQNI